MMTIATYSRYLYSSTISRLLWAGRLINWSITVCFYPNSRIKYDCVFLCVVKYARSWVHCGADSDRYVKASRTFSDVIWPKRSARPLKLSIGRNVQLEKAQLVFFHQTCGATDNVRLVHGGTCILWHNNAAKHMILTIRLPRYFSTSDKLRTDTSALGIIIRSLWSILKS